MRALAARNQHFSSSVFQSRVSVRDSFALLESGFFDHRASAAKRKAMNGGEIYANRESGDFNVLEGDIDNTASG